MPLAAFPKCFLEALIGEKEMSVAQWVDLSAQFDIDGLEFFSGFAPLEPGGKWREFARDCAQLDRAIPMLCHSPDFTHPEGAFRMREVERQKGAIDVAVTLGAKYCRILSGQRRPEVTRAEGIRWAGECIRESVEYAAQRGIVLNLENHYKDHTWLYPEFAQKREIFLELLSGVPESEWFGVNYDPSNCIIAGEDPIAMLEAVKTRVVTMHASDRYFEEGKTFEDLREKELDPMSGYASILRHGVIGKGMNDYDRIFSILRLAGFRGWISIEDGPDPATGVEDIRESAVYLRGKMKEHHLP
jgi:sugar phosphate isomerase/epimerase